MGTTRGRKISKRAIRRRRRRLGAILIVFALLLILAICLIVRSILSQPYEKVDLSELVNITYEGYDTAGNAIVTFDDAKVDELMAKLRDDYDEAWFHTTKAEDSDYALFRQSLTCGVLGAEPTLVAASDVTSDASLDTNSDVTLDTNSDVTLDTNSDVTLDANSDVSLDAASDVTLDAASDVTLDANSDVTLDANSDVTLNPTSDVSLDATSDVTSNGTKYSAETSMRLKNGTIITVTCNYDAELAEKLKLEVVSSTGQFTVGGLPSVTFIGIDDVFSGLNVSFTGISPNLTMSMENTSTNPLVSRMSFEIVDPKEFYRAGDTISVRAVFTEEMCLETKYVVNVPQEECVKEFVAESDSSYLSSAAELPNSILKEAIDAGKKAFKDANEYGVRIYCEANLVPVYINKKATFEYGAPSYVSSYFKTVFPEKAGELGMSYNDLDIIYEVKITQADGVSCKAFAAVRFSNIIQNSDGTYDYDFSDAKILSESYFSDRVKKNVTESYKSSHNVERVYP